MVKHSLRKEMLERRAALTEQERSGMSHEMAKRLISDPKFLNAKIIGFYLPKGNEADTREMIEEALKLGKEVGVPVTNDHIEFFRFISFDDLVPGKYGIPEPKARIPLSGYPEIILIPGVAFGRCMHRIGYGKAYYDQFLRDHPAYRIGLCYDFQVMEKLPRHPHDQPMDEIITEKRLILPANKQ